MDLSRFDKKNFSADQILGAGLKPDTNFSVSHNVKVLMETNMEMDKREELLDKKLSESCGNIADILAHYAKATLDRGEHKSIEQYLGKAMMKKLYGDRLFSKLGRIDQIRERNLRDGNTEMNGYFYMPGIDD